jgi:predicted phosphohydrolase
LIHSGDISQLGHQVEVESFFNWFDRQPHTYRILVLGNHDISFDPSKNLGIQPFWVGEVLKQYLMYDSLNFLLNDSGCQIEGINFWGSPYTPLISEQTVNSRWAFMESRKTIKRHWKMIPYNTDILITHGPPHGILDDCFNGDSAGCEHLRLTIEHVKPKVHLFGHIHEASGMSVNKNTVFINGSCVNERYAPIDNSTSFSINLDDKEIYM